MPRKDPELCSKIRDRVDKWEKYWTINRSLYYEWVEFVLGDQWLEDESKLFERYNKIPLTSNKLAVLRNNLCGDFIQNTPNLQVMPEEDVSTEQAEIRQSLVKHITFNSDSKTILQKCYAQSLLGFSGARVSNEYIGEFSFDQELKIYGSNDPNNFYWDRSAQHQCKIDGKYSGYKTRMSRSMFRDIWGQDIEVQIGSTAITEDSTMAFADDDSITIVDDYEKVKDESFHTLYKLSNGESLDNKKFKDLEDVKINGKKYKMMNGNAVTVLDKKKITKYKIVHRQIAGDFVLDETDFPSGEKCYLPIVFIDQDSYYTKSGQQLTRSFFKDVKDNQKYLNYLMTQSAYLMKTLRYDQFLVPRSAVQNPDTQQIWRDPSILQGGLVYDTNQNGDKPEQLRPPELSQSLLTQYERTLMDIQSGTGVYNNQLGEVGNEVSGTAIKRRNLRGQKNSQQSRTSIEIALSTIGEIINDIIPEVYDTNRKIVLPMAESDQKLVEINKPMDEYGLNVQNDLTKGRYKIYLKPGLSYEGQKEEALESLNQALAASSSPTFNLISDLYVENLPLDNSIEMRNRFRTLVPPEIIEAGKTGKPLPPKPPQPSPEQMMMQLKQQELQQKAQQAQAEMQRKMQELELKKAELQRKAIESHQDMSLAWEKLEAEKEESAAELQGALLRYQAEMQRIGADLNIADSQNLIRLLTHNNSIQKG